MKLIFMLSEASMISNISFSVYSFMFLKYDFL